MCIRDRQSLWVAGADCTPVLIALLENQPGELLINKEAVMAEAKERANRARNMLRTQEQDAG